MEWSIPMSSSNSPDKNISGRDDETTDPNTTDATAGTRPTDTPSPYVRDYRKRRASTSTQQKEDPSARDTIRHGPGRQSNAADHPLWGKGIVLSTNTPCNRGATRDRA